MGLNRLTRVDRNELLDFNTDMYFEIGHLILNSLISDIYDDGAAVSQKLFKKIVYALFSNSIFRKNDKLVRKDDVDVFLAQLDKLDNGIDYSQNIYNFVLELIGYTAFVTRPDYVKAQIYSVNQIDDSLKPHFVSFTKKLAENCMRTQTSKTFVKDMWAKLKDSSSEVVLQLKELKTFFSVEALGAEFSGMISNIIHSKLSFINVYDSKVIISSDNGFSLKPVLFSTEFYSYNNFLNNEQSLLRNHFAILELDEILMRHGEGFLNDIEKIQRIYNDIARDFTPVNFYTLDGELFLESRNSTFYFSFYNVHTVIHFLHYLTDDFCYLRYDEFTLDVNCLPVKSLYSFKNLVEITKTYNLSSKDLKLISSEFLPTIFNYECSNNVLYDQPADDLVNLNSYSDKEETFFLYLDFLKLFIESKLKVLDLSNFTSTYVTFNLLKSLLFYIGSYLDSGVFDSRFLLMKKGDQIEEQNQFACQLFLPHLIPSNNSLESYSAFFKKARLTNQSIACKFDVQQIELNLLTGSSYNYVKELLNNDIDEFSLNELYKKYTSLEFLESVSTLQGKLSQAFDLLKAETTLKNLSGVYSIFCSFSSLNLEFFLFENKDDLHEITFKLIEDYLEISKLEFVLEFKSNTVAILFHYFLNVLLRFKKIDSFTFGSLSDNINEKSDFLDFSTYPEVDSLRYVSTLKSVYEVNKTVNQGFLLHILERGIDSTNLILFFDILESLNLFDVFIESLLYKKDLEDILNSLLDLDSTRSHYLFRMIMFKVLSSKVTYSYRKFQSVFLKVYSCKKTNQLRLLKSDLEMAILALLDHFPLDIYEDAFDSCLDSLLNSYLKKSKCSNRIPDFDIDKVIASNSIGFLSD
ncbi:hypothetical protein CL656_05525 [bacterium]|nr:hypothetical protein [bacterium]|tara:strand:- start:1876 stop:4461 length:2586 start_codon:yes stop_codon:yes gene_type:complete